MSKLSVYPARVIYQAVELPNGRVIAVEMETPGRGFAVVHENDGEVEIVSLHPDEQTATDRCKSLAQQIESMAGAEGQGRLH